MGNGQLTMSNIFLSAALLTLAQEEINCNDENIECGKVHGYKPSSLITIIGTVSGLLSAIFLPIIGSIVDTTSHRRSVGIASCVILMSVQAIQISTNQNTWFVMAILQAFNGFIYQIVILFGLSYTPEISRMVGGELMNQYTAEWSMAMLVTQILYMFIVTGLSVSLALGDVETGQLGQAINVPSSGICYAFACVLFTKKGPGRQKSPNETIVSSGFKQVFRTANVIWSNRGPTLGWFLLSVAFAESAAGALTLVAVTYLKEIMRFSGNALGLLFIIVIVFSIPGTLLGSYVTKRTCPKTSMKIQLIIFILVNTGGFFSLNGPGQEHLAYFYGALWGILLGWFYPTESLMFSMLVPRGQEAELAGFYLYCSQIFAWLPPLVFTVMNEGGVPLEWAGMHLNLYLLIAYMCYHYMSPWNECIALTDQDPIFDDSSYNISGQNRSVEMDDLRSTPNEII